jgi:hypothetical protein
MSKGGTVARVVACQWRPWRIRENGRKSKQGLPAAFRTAGRKSGYQQPLLRAWLNWPPFR